MSKIEEVFLLSQQYCPLARPPPGAGPDAILGALVARAIRSAAEGVGKESTVRRTGGVGRLETSSAGAPFPADGRPVKDTRDLIDTVSAQPPGTKLTLGVVRGGDYRKLTVELEERAREGEQVDLAQDQREEGSTPAR